MKKFLLCFIAFVSIFCCFGCRKSDNLSVISKNNTNYEIELDLNVEDKTVYAKQKVDYFNNTNSILKVLEFNLYPQFFEEGAVHNVVSGAKLANTFPNGMSYADFKINRLFVEGKDIEIKYDGEYEEILLVDLGKSLMPKQRTELGLEFSFKIPNCCHRFGYGENTINLGNFYPILCVYENGSFINNGYSPNGDPFYSEVANYSVSVNLPNEYIVASTGSKISEKTIGNGKKVTYTAEMVRDFAMVVSNKFKIKSKKIKNCEVLYYYYSDDKSDEHLQTGVDAIKTFSELFGEYPYKTYSIVQNDFVHGGMEYPNLVMINGEIEYDVDYKNVIVHETAHQWWYGVVGNNEMNNPWLDEALTEFSTILFYDYNKNYKLSHKEMINKNKENFSLFITVYQDVLGYIDTSMRACNEYETEPEYTYCIYVKGSLMFESLYQLTGNKNFVKSLKHYYEKNKYKNATPQDLIFSFNKICGADFSKFFNSWISGKVVIR